MQFGRWGKVIFVGFFYIYFCAWYRNDEENIADIDSGSMSIKNKESGVWFNF